MKRRRKKRQDEPLEEGRPRVLDPEPAPVRRRRYDPYDAVVAEALSAPAPKRTRGLPPFDAAKVNDALRLLNAGVDLRTACLAADIPRAHFDQWMAAARDPKRRTPELLQFLRTVDQAKALAKARLVSRWSQLADQHWQAARALLVVMDPDTFAPSAERPGEVAVEEDVPGLEPARQPIRFFIPQEAPAMPSLREPDPIDVEGEEVESDDPAPAAAPVTSTPPVPAVTAPAHQNGANGHVAARPLGAALAALRRRSALPDA